MTLEEMAQDEVPVKIQVHPIGGQVFAEVTAGIGQGVEHIEERDVFELPGEVLQLAIQLADRRIDVEQPLGEPGRTLMT